MLQKSKENLREYKRVLQVTKKPDRNEFLTVFKVSGIGILIIGAIGFIINMMYQALFG
jgi:protein transport protein SEC61 subunit gamma-like protein